MRWARPIRTATGGPGPEVPREKGVVLEPAEQAEVCADGGRNPRPSGFFFPVAAIGRRQSYGDGQQHERKKPDPQA
jgi:hypothetical protein